MYHSKKTKKLILEKLKQEPTYAVYIDCDFREAISEKDSEYMYTIWRCFHDTNRLKNKFSYYMKKFYVHEDGTIGIKLILIFDKKNVPEIVRTLYVKNTFEKILIDIVIKNQIVYAPIVNVVEIPNEKKEMEIEDFFDFEPEIKQGQILYGDMKKVHVNPEQ